MLLEARVQLREVVGGYQVVVRNDAVVLPPRLTEEGVDVPDPPDLLLLPQHSEFGQRQRP